MDALEEREKLAAAKEDISRAGVHEVGDSGCRLVEAVEQSASEPRVSVRLGGMHGRVEGRQKEVAHGGVVAGDAKDHAPQPRGMCAGLKAGGEGGGGGGR
eukprot:scaffold225818_cov16-Tisochrysis_lutea.AAC.2